ncbi:hypothetical protein NKG05_16455 [Oerskovia sp. M15]
MTSDPQGPEEQNGSEDQPFHFTDKRKVTPEGSPRRLPRRPARPVMTQRPTPRRARLRAHR